MSELYREVLQYLTRQSRLGRPRLEPLARPSLSASRRAPGDQKALALVSEDFPKASEVEMLQNLVKALGLDWERDVQVGREEELVLEDFSAVILFGGKGGNLSQDKVVRTADLSELAVSPELKKGLWSKLKEWRLTTPVR